MVTATTERAVAQRRRRRGVKKVERPAVEQYHGADWVDHAVCRDEDVNLFFEPGFVQSALDVCERCPVMWACRDDAIESRDYDIGVRGGASAGAIRRMRVQEQRMIDTRNRRAG